MATHYVTSDPASARGPKLSAAEMKKGQAELMEEVLQSFRESFTTKTPEEQEATTRRIEAIEIT